MSDHANISSAPRASTYAATTLSGTHKDENAAKGSDRSGATGAKNTFMGRMTSWLAAHHPSKAATEIKQKLFTAIGHMFQAGTLSNLLKNATDHLRNAKQLLARTISSAPPPGLEKWHELDKMKSRLADLKLEKDMLHEQAHHYYGEALRKTDDERPMNAAKKAYIMEAEVKTKVEAQEKNVADLEKALSKYQRPPAARMLTAPRPERSAETEKIDQPSGSKVTYSLPSNPHAHLSMRERVRLGVQQLSSPQAAPRPQGKAPAYYVPARGNRPAAASFTTASQAPLNQASTAHAAAAQNPVKASSIAADLAKLMSQDNASPGKN